MGRAGHYGSVSAKFIAGRHYGHDSAVRVCRSLVVNLHSRTVSKGSSTVAGSCHAGLVGVGLW